MNQLVVRREGGDRYRMQVRGHQVLVDQPLDDGGEDTAATPTELFVAGLAACVAFYAGRFLRRHGISEDGLAVECDFAFASDRPARVGEISLRVLLPPGFPEVRRKALRSVVEHCTVHNTLRQPPAVEITLETS